MEHSEVFRVKKQMEIKEAEAVQLRKVGPGATQTGHDATESKLLCCAEETTNLSEGQQWLVLTTRTEHKGRLLAAGEQEQDTPGLSELWELEPWESKSDIPWLVGLTRTGSSCWGWFGGVGKEVDVAGLEGWGRSLASLFAPSIW